MDPGRVKLRPLWATPGLGRQHGRHPPAAFEHTLALATSLFDDAVPVWVTLVPLTYTSVVHLMFPSGPWN